MLYPGRILIPGHLGQVLRFPYEHSGEREIDWIPNPLPDRKLMSIDDILIDVGTNYITHMVIYLDYEMMPELGVVCPQATHLRIISIQSRDSIERYVLI